MRYLSALLALPIALVAGCVSPRAVHAPPPPIPVPVVAPPAPVTTDWRDIPLTPGDWSYGAVPGGSAARFGRPGVAPDFTARCDMATRTVSLVRYGGTAPATMTVTTSAGNRAFPAAPLSGPPPALAASLPARDGFLDRMAFSRGRFVVAVGGMPRLVIPAWPEFARVVEDCRG